MIFREYKGITFPISLLRLSKLGSGGLYYSCGDVIAKSLPSF